MQTVNLKKYYYELYRKDTFVEVSDEVAEALLLMLREENNRVRKIYYHKAYFSLDREDGIENDALCGFEKSPEDIFMEQEEERFFLLTLERLDEALSHLTPAQEQRIRARYLDGRKTKEIADAEGVSIHVIYESLQRGLKSLQRYGRYKNVFLRDEELTELQTELPTLWQNYIDRLSEYMASTGKQYQNHAATIRRWAAEDKKKAAPQSRNRDYSVQEGETV